MPSFGSVGDALDNAIIESFWSSTQIELADAIFEYIEIFYNRQRRNSQLGYHTPIEFELTYEKSSIPA